MFQVCMAFPLQVAAHFLSQHRVTRTFDTLPSQLICELQIAIIYASLIRLRRTGLYKFVLID